MADRYHIDEIMAIAEEIERNGARFYARAAGTTDDPETHTLFQRLAAWESGHEKRFQEMRARIAAQDGFQPPDDPDLVAEEYLRFIASNHVFRGSVSFEALLASAGTTLDALRLALRFEMDSILLFTGMKASMRETWERDAIEGLILEETSHVVWLNKLVQARIRT